MIKSFGKHLKGDFYLSNIKLYPFINTLLSIYLSIHDKGDVFSGSGDGFRQMMPFQMYLYEHFASFKGFYDASFWFGWRLCEIISILLLNVTTYVDQFCMYLGT